MIRVKHENADKKAISAAWKAAGVDLEFYDVERAKKPYKLRNGESISQAIYPMNSMLSISEIGCYFSHYRVWGMALEEAWPCVLILEEDAYPTDCFRTVIKHVLEIKDPDAMVMLFHEISRKTQSLHIWKDGVRLTRLMEKGSYSAMGYVLYRGAIRKMATHLGECQMPVDHIYDYTFTSRVNSYTVKPYAVKNSKEHKSHLEGERQKEWDIEKINKSRLARKLKRRIFYKIVGGMLSRKFMGRLVEKDWDSEIFL